MRKYVIIAAVASLVGACGGSSSEDTTTTQSVAPTTEATTTTVVATTSEPDSEGGDLGALSGVCLSATEDMSEAMAAYSEGLAGLMTGSFDPESLEQVAGQLEAAAEAAPDEISDDFAVIADEMGSFYRALAAMDYEPGSMPTEEQAAQLAALAESMDQEALQDASENIAAWYEDNCSG